MTELNVSIHVDPEIHYPSYDILQFTDYIAECRKLVKKYRVDLIDNPLAETIIDVNTPFEIRPTNAKIKTGILLLHGFLDSPFILSDIAAELPRDALIRSVLLPGHGTVPGALLNVRWQQWSETLLYGMKTLLEEVDHVYIIGFSTGALLALYHTLQHHQDPRIAGIVLICPAIKIKSFFDFTANWHKPFSRVWQRAAWLNKAAEIDYAKYQSICFNGVYQIYELTQLLKKLSATRTLSQPMLCIASSEDTTVNSQRALEYFSRYATRDKSMFIMYGQSNSVNDSRVEYRSGSYPQHNITSLSHVSLPISPNNFHYGIRGDFVDASHTDDEKQFTYGELDGRSNKINLEKYRRGDLRFTRRRLTYNPDFDAMMSSILHFINS